MDSLPTWAVWLIVVPLVLMSPVIVLLLAMAVEILVFVLVGDGAPALVLVGDEAGGLLLFRMLRVRYSRSPSNAPQPRTRCVAPTVVRNLYL
jgi:hypothetical protein